MEGKERTRKFCFYKNGLFPTVEDMLFFILVYFKQYPTQTYHAKSFNTQQPKANQWIHFITPILQKALAVSGVTPCRDMAELELPQPELFSHDGMERPIQRPKNNEQQKIFYSGKQKCHTVKNNVLANACCKIIYLTPTVEGKKHDKKLADESNYQLPKGSQLLQDTGFQGFSVEEVEIIQPKKKQKINHLPKVKKIKIVIFQRYAFGLNML